jgi:MoxR-like ATPase
VKPYRPAPEPHPIRDKFAQARSELSKALIERDDEIDLVLTALLANEHVLLVGPPGCGKSLLLDSVLSWTGGTKFSILFTKYTVPEECLGPVSLSAIKEDRYVRVTTGKLPEADYAFCDEIFKASSAILTTLLKILNERVYDAGNGGIRKVPLRLCVAASNEWPSPDNGKELSALFDRFVARKTVSSIRSQPGRQRLLWTRDHTPRLSATVTPAEVDEAYRPEVELIGDVEGSLRRLLAAVLPGGIGGKELVEPGEIVLPALAGGYRSGVQFREGNDVSFRGPGSHGGEQYKKKTCSQMANND